MIISEKQVIKLIMIVQHIIEDLMTKDICDQVRAYQMQSIIEEIINQQSEELKVVE